MMEKKGAPPAPQMGKVAVPWPSPVLVYKAQEGCFVPQPQITGIPCPQPGCDGVMMKWPDGHCQCQKCLKENV